MAECYFGFLFGKQNAQKSESIAATPSKLDNNDTIVQDEQIGEWTHKFVVYCKNPSAEFEKELKEKSEVVAVFTKEKTSKKEEVKEQ